jgi:hypothetical protein
MSTTLLRYNTDPLHTDTTGFFNADVPFNSDKYQAVNDSMLKFYNYPGWQGTTKKDTVVARETISIFTPHQLKPVILRPVPNTPVSTDWITGIFIFCLLILATVQVTVPRRLQQVFRSVALPYYVNQLEREGNLLSERFSIALLFVYITSLTLLLYKLSTILLPADALPFKGWVLYALIFAACIVLSLLKTSIISFSGVVFKTSKVVHEYLINNMIFSIVTGIILFPAVIISLYINNPFYVWIACSIFSILLVYRFVRSFIIGLSNLKYSVFYLFLYLCTLEILPLLLLFKTVQKF